MNTHKTLIMLAGILLSSFLLAGCKDKTTQQTAADVPGPALQMQSSWGDSMTDNIEKTEEEWKALLSPEQYRVLRRQGTERAFTGAYHDYKNEGEYLCAACGQPLFSSETKYDSGTGWPSFYAPIGENQIGTEIDRRLGSHRTEVHCSRCGGHLGHVFNDGPAPTGLRYCINSASLSFSPDEKQEEKGHDASR